MSTQYSDALAAAQGLTDAEKTQLADAIKTTTTSSSGYQSPYASQISTLISEVTGPQGEFSYNKDEDPQYQALRKQRLIDADRTMKDVLAQQASGTGGQASSWAVSAASEASNYYKSLLSEQEQELYDSAYTKWQNEYTQKLQQLSALQEADDTAYSRTGDAYDRLVTLISNTGYSPTDAELAAAGMSSGEAAAWKSYYTKSLATASSGSSGGSSGSSSKKTTSTATSATSTSTKSYADIQATAIDAIDNGYSVKTALKFISQYGSGLTAAQKATLTTKITNYYNNKQAAATASTTAAKSTAAAVKAGTANTNQTK